MPNTMERQESHGTSSIKVDCLSRGKIRGSLCMRPFADPPTFRTHRVHLVEDTSSLLPLIEGTIAVCMDIEEGTEKTDAERFALFERERRSIASWVRAELEPQFDFPITVEEVSSEDVAKNEHINNYGDHRQAVRFAGMDRPQRFYGKKDKIFHIDYGRSEGRLLAEPTAGEEMDSYANSIQVNLWLNLRSAPITDHMLGFLFWEQSSCDGERGLRPLSGAALAHGDKFLGELEVSTVTNPNGEQKEEHDFQGFLEHNIGIRYQPGLRNDQALLFQATGEEAVVHGCCRFGEPARRTNVPRQSLEYRFIVRRA